MDYQNLTFIIQDGLVAAPAAFSRALLETRVSPNSSWLYTIGEKIRAFCLSISFGILAGQVTRPYPAVTNTVPIIVIISASAFMAQELGIKMLEKGKYGLNIAAQQILKKANPTEPK